MSDNKYKICREFTQLADGYLEHTKPEDGTKIKSLGPGLSFCYAMNDGSTFKYELSVLQDNRICVSGGEFPGSDFLEPEKRFFRPFVPGSQVTMKTGTLKKDGTISRGNIIGLDAEGTYVLASGFGYTLWIDGKAMVEINPCEEIDRLPSKNQDTVKEVAKKAMRMTEDLKDLVARLAPVPPPSTTYVSAKVYNLVKGLWSMNGRCLKLVYSTPLFNMTVHREIPDSTTLPFSLQEAFQGFPRPVSLHFGYAGTGLMVNVKDSKEDFVMISNNKTLVFRNSYLMTYKENEVFLLKSEGKVLMEIQCVA